MFIFRVETVAQNLIVCGSLSRVKMSIVLSIPILLSLGGTVTHNRDDIKTRKQLGSRECSSE